MLIDTHAGGRRWDDVACVKCGSVDSPDANAILLCDRCDRGYHQRCLRPALAEVPTGEWMCSDCCLLLREAAQHAPAHNFAGKDSLKQLESPLPEWMASRAMPADKVDLKLWSGAARAGWQVVPSARGAEKYHHWLYVAPCNVGFRNRASIFDVAEKHAAVVAAAEPTDTASDDASGRRSRRTQLVESPELPAAVRMVDCGSCLNCLDMRKHGGPGVKKAACISKVALPTQADAGMREAAQGESATTDASQAECDPVDPIDEDDQGIGADSNEAEMSCQPCA